MKTAARLLLLSAILIIPFTATSQIKVDVKRKVVNQTNDRANTRTDQGITKGLDGVENGIKNVFKKKDGSGQTDQQEQSQQPEQPVMEEQVAAENNNADAAPRPSQPALETYSKYDFVPGEKVFFYEDFSQDAIGDFPALWNTNGSAEVVTTNLFPGKWMKFSGRKCVWTDQMLQLPENYTIEFDVIPTRGEENERMTGFTFRLFQAINVRAWDGGAVPGKAGFSFEVDSYGTPFYRTYINNAEDGALGMSGSKEGPAAKQTINNKYHIAIWVQKSRVRLYQDENKLFDLPKAFTPSYVKLDRLRFEEGNAMVSNIRIAVGAPDTRSKLITEGKLVTYGIYFDVNKDIVKPESYGTLKEISTVLNENPGVKVKIAGFTDSDGDDASNLDLSKRRAASVKNELAKNFGVDGSRMETDGMGEGQPVAPNDTPSNKALNRRVEFTKL
jgi:OmpA-OmpF porin, OOP family